MPQVARPLLLLLGVPLKGRPLPREEGLPRLDGVDIEWVVS